MEKIIQANGKLNMINWKELFRYRDLLYFFVRRDITVLYKQSVLGMGWAIINPLILTLVFSIVFGGLAKMPSDGIPYPLFSLCATMPWTYFSNSTNASITSLIMGKSIFTKVYFPRVIFPITPIFSKLLDFFISFAILIIMMIIYKVAPTPKLLLLPLLILIMISFAAAVGIWLSSLALQYRDVRYAMTLLLQLLMYAAPVVFPASLVLNKYGSTIYHLYALYPMTGVIEGFRSAIIGDLAIPWNLILISSASSLIMLSLGLRYFSKMENKLADIS